MDGKMWAITGLVVMALLLGGIVANGFRAEQVAYGQGGVYSTYLAVTAEVRDDNVDFIILDTATRKMLFFTYNQAGKKLSVTTSGRRLLGDFQRKEP